MSEIELKIYEPPADIVDDRQRLQGLPTCVVAALLGAAIAAVIMAATWWTL